MAVSSGSRLVQLVRSSFHELHILFREDMERTSKINELRFVVALHLPNNFLDRRYRPLVEHGNAPFPRLGGHLPDLRIPGTEMQDSLPEQIFAPFRICSKPLKRTMNE